MDLVRNLPSSAMRHLYLIIALAFVAACNNKTSESPATPTDTAANVDQQPPVKDVDSTSTPKLDSIAYIREQVTAINSGTLEKKRFEFICDEKMVVDYFSRNGELVKISVDFGTVGDSYAKEDYYYSGGKLIFKYEFVEGGPACEGCITRHEYRSYIRNNKVIRYLKDQTAEACRTCNFDANAKEYRLLKASDTQAIRRVFCR